MKIITVSDLTLSGQVDRELIHQMFEDVDDPEEKIFVDFTDTSLWERDIDVLAEYVSRLDVEVHGLNEAADEKLGSQLSKEEQFDFCDFEEFCRMFQAKFPVGTLCIWDRTISKNDEKGRWNLEVPYSLIRIMGYRDNNVFFRRYHSAKLEPIYIKQHGGLDAEEMYADDQIHLSNLSSKDELIRYPKDEEEEIILRLFEEIG